MFRLHVGPRFVRTTQPEQPLTLLTLSQASRPAFDGPCGTSGIHPLLPGPSVRRPDGLLVRPVSSGSSYLPQAR
jgi:hypothetical protein